MGGPKTPSPPALPSGTSRSLEQFRIFKRDYPDIDIYELKAYQQAREAATRATARELALAKETNDLISVLTVLAIRDETVTLINDLVGPSLQSVLDQWEVPTEIVEGLHQQLYSGLAGIYAKHDPAHGKEGGSLDDL